MIDSDGTEASSDDENNRFCGIESAELQAFPCIAGQQFLADWRSGQNGFVFRETFNGFREITADLCSGRNTQLICQARRHIRFIDAKRAGRNRVQMGRAREASASGRVALGPA